MMSLIDLTNVSIEQNKVLPEGEFFEVVCDQAELRENKSKKGQHIYCRFKVTSGIYDGFYIVERFNIKNDNPVAVTIALQKLKRFMLDAGMSSTILASEKELLGLRVQVQLGIQEDSYGRRNFVLGYAEIPPPSFDLNDPALPPYMEDKKDDSTTEDAPF